MAIESDEEKDWWFGYGRSSTLDQGRLERMEMMETAKGRQAGNVQVRATWITQKRQRELTLAILGLKSKVCRAARMEGG